MRAAIFSASLFIGAFSVSVHAEHVASIPDGAVPKTLGCKEGCDKINKFRSWLPYLQKVADIQKYQEKCVEIFDVMPDISSDPRNPSFRVMCYDKNKNLYNTFYTKDEVDRGAVDQQVPYTRQEAYDLCDKKLLDWANEKGIALSSINKGYRVSNNGTADVRYDFKASGNSRKARCLVGKNVYEFSPVN